MIHQPNHLQNIPWHELTTYIPPTTNLGIASTHKPSLALPYKDPAALVHHDTFTIWLLLNLEWNLLFPAPAKWACNLGCSPSILHGHDVSCCNLSNAINPFAALIIHHHQSISRYTLNITCNVIIINSHPYM